MDRTMKNSNRTVIVDLRAFFPPPAKFQVGDFARHGHGSEKGIVRIESRHYFPKEGWVYSHSYRPDFRGSRGGCSAPREAEYIPLTDPLDKLRAGIATRADRKSGIESELKRLNEEIARLEFALEQIL